MKRSTIHSIFLNNFAGQLSISTPPLPQYGLECQDSGWSNLSWKTKLQMAWIEIAQSSWLLCSLQPCPNTATLFFSSHGIEVSAVELEWSLRSNKNNLQTRWSSVVSQKDLGGGCGAEDLFQHVKVQRISVLSKRWKVSGNKTRRALVKGWTCQQ